MESHDTLQMAAREQTAKFIYKAEKIGGNYQHPLLIFCLTSYFLYYYFIYTEYHVWSDFIYSKLFLQIFKNSN